MTRPRLLAIALPLAAVSCGVPAPGELPASATTALARSLEAAKPHEKHVWRDVPPVNGHGTITAYVEIPTGDRRKWEFDMARNERAIDRMIPEAVGGYPINYGFVPQTVSYDGDPFDALILGPPLEGGQIVSGVPIGLLRMEDEKGLDSKVVLSPIDRAGRPLYQLTAAIRRDVADYFRRYKRHEPAGFSRVSGWGSATDGRDFVRVTHAFFQECRDQAGMACEVAGR